MNTNLYKRSQNQMMQMYTKFNDVFVRFWLL